MRTEHKSIRTFIADSLISRQFRRDMLRRSIWEAFRADLGRKPMVDDRGVIPRRTRRAMARARFRREWRARDRQLS